MYFMGMNRDRLAIFIRKQWIDPEAVYERLEHDDYPDVILFARKNEEYEILCCLNAGEGDCTFMELLEGEVLMGEKMEGNDIGPGGFCIVKNQNRG